MESKLSRRQIDDLIEAARQVRQHAYAPYSQFGVGAALLAVNGHVYTGCNVENGSYGLTLCAERAAVANAVSAGCREFQALAIVADTGDAPATPCGACRQVLAEFNPLMTVICASESGRVRILRLDELLPDHFEFGLR